VLSPHDTELNNAHATHLINGDEEIFGECLTFVQHCDSQMIRRVNQGRELEAGTGRAVRSGACARIVSVYQRN
jgi:hypothetical protein